MIFANRLGQWLIHSNHLYNSQSPQRVGPLPRWVFPGIELYKPIFRTDEDQSDTTKRAGFLGNCIKEKAR
jgi:hypothetical protein